MSIKTLLVCLTTVEHAETLMKLAVPLARAHRAHLIGLHTVQAVLIYPGVAVHIPDSAFAAFNESQRKDSEDIKAVFAGYTDNEDFQSEFRLVRAKDASAAERMIESARAADVVIMSSEDKDADRYDQRHSQARVIRESGRPVIVVPLGYEGPALGNNIVLGWSDTREAARAGHDLLSVAQPAAEVTVLRVDSSERDALKDFDGIDLTETLTRHGLTTTLERRAPGRHGIAEVLSAVAFEKGADLIVTGAFGHSKAYDFVIGATTHALLRDAKQPVMFSK